MNKDHLLVYRARPAPVAEHIAEASVTERLAACVDILPGLVSAYPWNKPVQSNTAPLLVIKTTGQTYPALEARIQRLHPYGVVEISARPRWGSPAYLNRIDPCLESTS